MTLNIGVGMSSGTAPMTSVSNFTETPNPLLLTTALTLLYPEPFLTVLSRCSWARSLSQTFFSSDTETKLACLRYDNGVTEFLPNPGP